MQTVPQDGTCNVSQDILRNASLVLTALLRQLLTLLFHRVANRVANFAASDVASHDYHSVANRVASDAALYDYRPVANPVLTVLLTGKNLLLGWRHWPVGAASEPLRLRVAGGRRWLAY